MLPSFELESITGRDRSSSMAQDTVAWTCIPYFCLREHNSFLSTSGKDSHPMQTLWQTRSAMVRGDRDAKQAVRLLEGNNGRDLFYIAQLWSLVVGDCQYTLPYPTCLPSNVTSPFDYLCGIANAQAAGTCSSCEPSYA